MRTPVDWNILLRGFSEVLKILAAGSVGFVTALLVLRKQLNEFRIERKKNRKIEACNIAINSIVTLLESIAEFSEISKQIKKATGGKYNISNVHTYPLLHKLVIVNFPRWQTIADNYLKAMTETWRAYSFLRLTCNKERSEEITKFTDYLNSFITEGKDIDISWKDMREKANINIEKMKKEIDNTE